MRPGCRVRDCLRLRFLLAGVLGVRRDCAAASARERSTAASRLETRTEDSGWLASSYAYDADAAKREQHCECVRHRACPPGRGVIESS